MFNKEQLLKDKNLAKALIWRGPDKFSWSTVSVLNGPNQYGQYVVMAVRDGWYAVTDKIRNLNDENRDKIINDLCYCN